MERTTRNFGEKLSAFLGFEVGRADLLAMGFMLFTLCLFFAEAIFGGQVFYFRDVCVEIVPKRHFLIESGFDVLWNPYSFNGIPGAANPQWFAFYPLNFIFLLGSAARTVTFFIIAHFALALFGTYVFLKSSGFSRGASLAGSLAWAYGGFFISLGLQVVVLNSAAWITPLLWAVMRFYRTGDLRFLCLSGLFWGMQALGGEPQIAALSGALAPLFLLAGPFQEDGQGLTRGKIKRAAWAVCGSLGLALAISAVQWVPTLELSGLSNRAGGLEYSEAVRWSLDPRALATLLIPNYISEPSGNPFWIMGLRPPTLPYLLSLYPGLAALLLAGAGVMGKRKKEWLMLAAAMVLFLVLAMGENAGLYWIFYKIVPGFDRFRIPERLMMGFALPLCYLAAMGVDALARTFADPGSPEGKPASGSSERMVPFVSLVLAAAALFLSTRGLSDRIISLGLEAIRSRLFYLAACRTIFIAGLCLFAWTLIRTRAGMAARICPALFLLVFIDLYSAHKRVNPTQPESFYNLEKNAAEEILKRDARARVMTLLPEDPKLRSLVPGRDPVDFFKSRRYWLRPFTGLELRLRDAGSRSSFYPFDVDLWLKLASESPEMGRKLASLSGIQWIVSQGKEPVRTGGALPLAYVVPRARFFPDRESVIEAMRDPSFDPRAEVLLEGEPPAQPPKDVGSLFIGQTPFIETNGRATFLVEPNHPGYLVFLDSHYPGWKAKVNGKEREILRANGFFKAVEVNREGPRVDFVFMPSFFYPALILSLATGLFIAWVLMKRGPFFYYGSLVIILVGLPFIEGGTTYVPVTALRVIVLLLAAAWSFRIGGQSQKTIYATKLDKWILGFWLLASISFAMSDYYYISLYWCLNIIAYVFLFYFILQFTSQVGDEEGGQAMDRRQAAEARVRAVMLIAVAAGALQCASALVQDQSSAARATGGFFNPNYLAGFIMILAPYALYRSLASLLAGPAGWRGLAGWGALFVLFLAGVISSQSRAAVILAVPLMFVAVPMIRKAATAWGASGGKALRLSIGIPAAAAALGLVFLAATPNPLRERVRKIGKDPYAFERVNIWAAGLKVIGDHPLGVGPGMFKYYAYKHKFPVEGVPGGRFEKSPTTAHNEYIHLAAEMSPLAAVCLMVPAFIMIFSAWRGAASEGGGTALALAAGLLGVCLHALVDSNLQNQSIAALTAVVCGCLASSLGAGGWPGLREIRPGPWTAGIVALAVAAAFLVISSLSLYLAQGYGLYMAAQAERSPDKASILLADAILKSSGNTGPYQKLASAYYAKFKGARDPRFLSKALKLEEEASRLNPADPGPYRKKGQILLDGAMLADSREGAQLAEAAFERALEMNPSDIGSLMGLAMAARFRGDKAREIELWKKAVAVEPYDLPSSLNLARALLEAGRKEEAMAAWMEFVKKKREVDDLMKKRKGDIPSSYRRDRFRLDQTDITAIEAEFKNLASKGTSGKILEKENAGPK